MQKWQRNYLLTVEANNGEFIEIRMPLTLEFHITHNIMSSSNIGSFRIYNLSRKTRDVLYRDQFDFNDIRSLKLQAGYGEGTLPTIFDGNVKQIYSCRSKDSVNFITEIEGFDFSFPMVKSFSHFTMAPPTVPTVTKQMVIHRLIGDMVTNTPNGKLGVGFIGTFNGDYPRGRTICEPTWDALQTETDKNCFIHKGKIHCLNNDEAYDGSIQILSSETGLLSTPKRCQTYLFIDLLFEPNLEMGQTISLQSNTLKFDGFYKVIGIEHRGVISGAVSSECVTTATLNYGTKLFSTITTQGLPQEEGVLG